MVQKRTHSWKRPFAGTVCSYYLSVYSCVCPGLHEAKGKWRKRAEKAKGEVWWKTVSEELGNLKWRVNLMVLMMLIAMIWRLCPRGDEAGKNCFQKTGEGGRGEGTSWKFMWLATPATANILLKQERLQLAEASYCDYTYIACIYYITWYTVSMWIPVTSMFLQNYDCPTQVLPADFQTSSGIPPDFSQVHNHEEQQHRPQQDFHGPKDRIHQGSQSSNKSNYLHNTNHTYNSSKPQDSNDSNIPRRIEGAPTSVLTQEWHQIQHRSNINQYVQVIPCHVWWRPKERPPLS